MLLADEIFYKEIEELSLLDLLTPKIFADKGLEVRNSYKLLEGLSESQLESLTFSDQFWYNTFDLNRKAMVSDALTKMGLVGYTPLHTQIRDALLNSIDKTSDYELGLRALDLYKRIHSLKDGTLKDRILNSVIFQCGNVEKLYTASSIAGKEFSVKDIVSLLPPFESIFIEFSTPLASYTSARAGVLMESIPRHECASTEAGSNSQFDLNEMFDRSTHIVRATTIMQMEDGRILGPLAVTEYGVGEFGELIVPANMTTNQFSWGISLPFTSVPEIIPNDELFRLIGHFDSYFKTVAMLAVSFTHLRNVNIIERDPNEANGKAAAKKARTKGSSLERYKVLDIPGIRDVTEGIRNAHAEGRVNDLALFFSRAHTKTYTADAPLFGKHVGTWAWSPRWIGDLQNGVIDKSYKVDVGPGLEL